MTDKKPFNLFLTVIILTAFAVPVILPETSHCAHSEVKIGVLANRGKEAAIKTWSKTASYLTGKIPQHRFTIVPLDFNEIDPAVSRKRVDFVVANPEFYVDLEAKYGVSRIATLKNRMRSGSYKVFGGVILCRADRSDIRDLQDLRGKKFMAVKEASLGGWTMAWREFKAQGIDPRRDFAELSYGGRHDSVVYAVRDRKVDAGTIRTDILERMADEGRMNLADFRILNRQDIRDFPLALSTRLYPEWPFAKVRHTPDELAQDVAIALLNMGKENPAARAAGIEGWTIPLDYQPVHELMKELRLGVYRDYGQITLAAAIRKYWRWLASALLLLLLLTLTTLYVIRLNRILRQSRLDLEKSRHGLEIKVRERTAELRNSERRLADIIDFLPDATFAVDLEGRIILWNRTAEEFTGAKAAEMLGKGNQEYSLPFFGSRRPALIDLVLNPSAEIESLYPYVKKEGGLVIGECYARSSKHDEAYILGIAAPLYDCEGRITGAIESIRDITERKEMERLKDEMISAVSHEMRTPLTAMLGYSEFLLENEVAPEQRQAYLQILMKETERLNELIGNFLDLQRLRSRRTPCTSQTLAVAPLLEESAALFGTVSQRHRLTVDCPAGLPRVRGDGKDLRQAVNNLVSNAIKYSPNGGEIHLGAHREDDGVIIMVRDEGIGIPQKAQEKIFERFYRVDNSDRRAIGGTGLGLTLVREIVTAHGGRIWVESEPGRGSTFFVSLPVA